MNHSLFLAALAVVVSGCAADFSEEKTNAPESSEETTSEPTVNVYGGHLQRPADNVGTVEDITQTANARAIRTYVETVDQAETELGPKFNRSQTQ
jgi:hypothetical protein